MRAGTVVTFRKSKPGKLQISLARKRACQERPECKFVPSSLQDQLPSQPAGRFPGPSFSRYTTERNTHRGPRKPDKGLNEKHALRVGKI